MKKYLYGLLAIILAITFSSFSIVKNLKKQTTYTFEYQKATYSKTDVESKLKTSWKVTTTRTCSNVNVKACKITVDAQYTTIDASGDRVLKTSGSVQITIVATASSPGVYYVDVVISVNITSVDNTH